jgi:hypothetical protein
MNPMKKKRVGAPSGESKNYSRLIEQHWWAITKAIRPDDSQPSGFMIPESHWMFGSPCS